MTLRKSWKRGRRGYKKRKRREKRREGEGVVEELRDISKLKGPPLTPML